MDSTFPFTFSLNFLTLPLLSTFPPKFLSTSLSYQIPLSHSIFSLLSYSTFSLYFVTHFLVSHSIFYFLALFYSLVCHPTFSLQFLTLYSLSNYFSLQSAFSHSIILLHFLSLLCHSFLSIPSHSIFYFFLSTFLLYFISLVCHSTFSLQFLALYSLTILFSLFRSTFSLYLHSPFHSSFSHHFLSPLFFSLNFLTLLSFCSFSFYILTPFWLSTFSPYFINALSILSFYSKFSI